MNTENINIYCNNLKKFGRNEMVENILIKELNSIAKCLFEYCNKKLWNDVCDLLQSDLRIVENTLKSIGIEIDDDILSIENKIYIENLDL